MGSLHVRDVKVSSKELFKTKEYIPASRMEIVRLTKPNAIVVSTVDSKSVFKKAWSLQVTN